MAAHRGFATVAGNRRDRNNWTVLVWSEDPHAQKSSATVWMWLRSRMMISFPAQGSGFGQTMPGGWPSWTRKPSSWNEACSKCALFHFCEVHQLCSGRLPLDSVNIPLDGAMGCANVTAECKRCIINHGPDNLDIRTWLVPHHTMHTNLLLPPHAPHVLSSPQSISRTQVPTSLKAHPENSLVNRRFYTNDPDQSQTHCSSVSSFGRLCGLCTHLLQVFKVSRVKYIFDTDVFDGFGGIRWRWFIV